LAGLFATQAESSDLLTFKHTGERSEDMRAALPKKSAEMDSDANTHPASDTRVPGDYLISHVGRETRNHLDKCLAADSVAVVDAPTQSCSICKRHRKLYGYRWPKTQQDGRHDNEERVYSLMS
jgi:hypothetical protein